jgi:hypothetical protein
MSAVRLTEQIDAGVLNVGYAETGPTPGPAVILLLNAHFTLELAEVDS